MLSEAVAITNGKGGVGKTSLVANLAGLAAARGYRVLAVDMDPQGNLARDLGYRQSGAGDQGRGLYEAVIRGSAVTPMVGVRDNLDVVAGGPELGGLADYLWARQSRSAGRVHRALLDVLIPVASNYHLILIDTPPGERLLQMLALTAAHFAVIPTKSDDASFDGLERIAQLFALIREGDEQMRPLNPDLQLLGVVVFGVGSASRAIRREAREQVSAELQDDQVVFQTAIRHVEGPAKESRRRGVLAHELESQTARARGEDDDPRSTASGLASDYASLTAEILQRWSDMRTSAPEPMGTS